MHLFTSAARCRNKRSVAPDGRDATLSRLRRSPTRAPVSRVLLLATVIGTTAAVGSCGYGPGSNSPISAAVDGTRLDRDASLIIATIAVPTGFDPHRERTSADRPYYLPIFDRLTTKSASGEVRPMLAESWETASDGMSMRMTLREGVRFHDGTPFDATAVTMSIDRARSIEGSTVKQYLAALDSVEEVAPLEVVFRYNVPTLEFDALLSGPVGAMISPAALADPGRDLRSDPGDAGTGPYLVDRFVPSQSVSYVRAPEPNWDPEAGNLASFEIRNIPDNRTRDSAIRAGEVDVAYINGAAMEAVQQAKLMAEGGTLVFVERPTSVLSTLFLHPDRLTDPRIREALVRGIDRDAIADGYFQGTCVSSGQLAREGFDGHIDDFVDPYPYDPERARELLAEAGAQPLQLELTYPTTRGEALPVISSDNLTDIGVDVTLRPAASLESVTWYRTGQTDSFMYAINSEPTLPNTVRWIQNWSSYKDATLNTSVSAAAGATDEEQRTRATQDLVETLAEAAVFVPICHMNTFFLVDSDVVGFDEALTGETQFMMDLRYVGRAAEDAR